MKRISIVIFLLCVLVLFGYSSEKSSQKSIETSIKQTIENAGIKFERICHMEVVCDGILVFYKDQYDLNACFLRNTSIGWKWISGGGGAALNPQKAISLYIPDHNSLPMHYYYGVISYSSIRPQVISKTIKNEYITRPAKIITTEDGLRIWFVIYHSEHELPIEVIGKNPMGDIYYHEPLVKSHSNMIHTF